MNMKQIQAMQAMMGLGKPSANWQERRASPALGLPNRLECGFASIAEAAQALKEAGIENVLRVQVSITREALQQAQLSKQMEAVMQISGASDVDPVPAPAPAAPAVDNRLHALETQLGVIANLLQQQQQVSPAPPPTGGDPNNP